MKVKRLLSLKLATKLTILENIYTIINSERTTTTSSMVPLMNILVILTNRITKVDTVKDQKRANLV